MMNSSSAVAVETFVHSNIAHYKYQFNCKLTLHKFFALKWIDLLSEFIVTGSHADVNSNAMTTITKKLELSGEFLFFSENSLLENRSESLEKNFLISIA